MRAQVIDLGMEQWLRGYVGGTCRSLAAAFLRFGASDDHVHLVVRVPPSCALATLVQRIKGGASHAWNTQRSAHAPQLHWQQGYWARSCDPAAVDELLDYVSDQRARHGCPGYREEWEPLLDARDRAP